MALPSFIEQLASVKDSNGEPYIQPTFSFFLTDEDGLKGKVILGGYDVEVYGQKGTTEDDIIWSNVTQSNDYFWTLSINQARLYGGKPLKSDTIYGEINLHSRYLMIDTGLSYALAPMSDIL